MKLFFILFLFSFSAFATQYINDLTVENSIQYTSGSGAGKVLTSDALGNATWQTVSARPVSKAGIVAGASFVSISGKRVYDVTFSTPYSDDQYIIGILSDAERVWVYENKTASGFRIQSNSNSSLSGFEIDWHTQQIGEF